LRHTAAVRRDVSSLIQREVVCPPLKISALGRIPWATLQLFRFRRGIRLNRPRARHWKLGTSRTASVVSFSWCNAIAGNRGVRVVATFRTLGTASGLRTGGARIPKRDVANLGYRFLGELGSFACHPAPTYTAEVQRSIAISTGMPRICIHARCLAWCTTIFHDGEDGSVSGTSASTICAYMPYKGN
jgi:hypothetical protein